MNACGDPMNPFPSNRAGTIATALRYELPTGMVALVQRNATAPTVSVYGEVRVGAAMNRLKRMAYLRSPVQRLSVARVIARFRRLLQLLRLWGRASMLAEECIPPALPVGR